MRLGVRAWNPSVFSMRLTVETDTSVPAASKSCWRSFAVSQGFLVTCLLRDLIVASDVFFLPRPGSVAKVPLTLNFRTMLPTVSFGIVRAFAIFFISFSLSVQGNNLPSELNG